MPPRSGCWLSGIRRRHLSETITGTRDWARFQVTGWVPADAEHMGFELTLVGPGRVWLRNVGLTRSR